MRIGIDGRSLQGFIAGNRAGVGRYVYELCRALDKLLPDAIFIVYSSVPVELPVISDRWILRKDSSPLARYLKPVFWLKYRCGHLCEQDNLDVFWGSATFLPRLPKTVPTVMTVYDLNYCIVPNTMSTTHRLAYKLFFESDLRKSKYVLTISKGTADRIYSLFARKVDDIVYPSVGKDFKVTHSSDTKRKILEKFGLNSPFILAVATWEPRKNLELLINCFIDLKQSGFLPRHDLVLAGGRGWKDERLLKLIGIQKSIRPLGYVPDIDLPILYSSADLFVFPSQYEGFGMPVLEARTCGATVVTSDIPELREAGGKDSCYVEPTATALKAAILNKLALEKTKTNDMLPNTTDWPHWIDSAKILSSYLNG